MHSGAALAQQQHRRGLSLSSAVVTNERDDDLTLFQEVRKREREQNAFIIPEAEELQNPRMSCRTIDQSLQILRSSAMPIKGFGNNDLLSLDWDKHDYDWLMTPPTTPYLLSVDCDKDSQGRALTRSATVRPSDRASKLGNPKSEPPSRPDPPSRSIRANLGFQQQCHLPNSSKPSLGLSTFSTSGLNSTVMPSTRASPQTVRLSPPAVTQTSKSFLSAVAPQAAMANGNTHPTPRLSASSSSRPPGFSRPPTPVKRSPSPSHAGNFPSTLVRCSSVNRASSMLSKSATLSRTTSPSSKAWGPEALYSSSQESLFNLRTSMPEKTAFNVRGIPGRVTQVDSGTRGRRQSSSPEVVRGRKSIALMNGAKGSVITGIGDCEAPLPNGTKYKKAGDKLAPSARKPSLSPQKGQGSAVVDANMKRVSKSTPFRDVKSLFNSVRGSSGTGQNQSKKSLDMAMKHMDICKNTPSKLRAFMSGMSKPSISGSRSSSNGWGTARPNFLDSPMATSSSTSSEHNASIVIDPDGDEWASEKGSRASVVSQHEVCTLSRDRRISRWLRSPDHGEDDDIMQIFQQEGLDSLSGPESPILVDLDGTIEWEEFCLDPM